MEELTINRPTPMTPENRKLLQAKNYGLENFLYDDNWVGTALYYKTINPGFTDDQCKAMEAFSNGVTTKQYRLRASSSSTHPSLPATAQSRDM